MKTKKIILSYLSLALLLAIITPSTNAKKIELVRFAEEINWPPFTPNVSGKVNHGLSYDLIKEVFSRIDVEVELELFPMKRVLHYLKNGTKDGATVISKNTERLKYLEYSDSIFQKLGLIYYLEDREKPIAWKSYSDLKGLIIGITSGHNYGKNFYDSVKKYNLKIEESYSVETNFKRLIKKRIDVLLCINLTAQSLLAKPEYRGKIIPASKPYYSKNYHIGFSKATKAKDLIPAVNQTIYSMKQDGTLLQIINKHINRPQ